MKPLITIIITILSFSIIGCSAVSDTDKSSSKNGLTKRINTALITDLTTKKNYSYREVERFENWVLEKAKSNPRKLLGAKFTFFTISDSPNTNPFAVIKFDEMLGVKKLKLAKSIKKLLAVTKELKREIINPKNYRASFVLEPLEAALRMRPKRIILISDLQVMDQTRRFEKGKWLSPINFCELTKNVELDIREISTDKAYNHNKILKAWWDKALYCKGNFWATYNKYKNQVTL